MSLSNSSAGFFYSISDLIFPALLFAIVPPPDWLNRAPELLQTLHAGVDAVFPLRIDYRSFDPEAITAWSVEEGSG